MKKCNKEYDLATNEKIEAWLELKEKMGYIPEITIEELQDLMDKLVFWYELKYPDFILDDSYLACNDPADPEMKEQVEALSEHMTFDQLMNRLTYNQYCFLTDIIQSCDLQYYVKVNKDDISARDGHLYVCYDLDSLEAICFDKTLEQILGGKLNVSYSYRSLIGKWQVDFDDPLVLSEIHRALQKNINSLDLNLRSANDYRKKILDLTALRMADDSKDRYFAWKRTQLFIEDIQENLHIAIGEGIEKARTLKRTRFDND